MNKDALNNNEGTSLTNYPPHGEKLIHCNQEKVPQKMPVLALIGVTEESHKRSNNR